MSIDWIKSGRYIFLGDEVVYLRSSLADTLKSVKRVKIQFDYSNYDLTESVNPIME